MLTSIILVYAYIPRGFRRHDKKQGHHPIKSPTLTEFHHLVRCWSCLEPPHCAARLSKRWDQVGRQGSLRSLITNDYEQGRRELKYKQCWWRGKHLSAQCAFGMISMFKNRPNRSPPGFLLRWAGRYKNRSSTASIQTLFPTRGCGIGLHMKLHLGLNLCKLLGWFLG